MKFNTFYLLLLTILSSCSNLQNFREIASLKKESIDPLKKRTKREWDKKSDPVNIFNNKLFETNVDRIKNENYFSHKPWSDSYWPTYKGGIAYRYQTSQTPFEINLSEDTYKTMSEDEIIKLSPAEKFDLYLGRYDVPTFRFEKNRTNPTNATWEGLCHGWAPASLFFDEPKFITLKNPDGKNIFFGTSDIKALLIYYTAFSNQVEENIKMLFAGNRCNDNATSNCMNTNAGAFHLLITNMIEQKIPMIIDVDRGIQVWNQPIYGYQITSMYDSNQISRYAAPGTVKEKIVKMKMYYSQEAQQSIRPVAPIIVSVEYQYTLELNNNNQIIGGEWLSSNRPDFIWTTTEPKFSANYYGAIKNIYTQSLSANINPTSERNSLDGISVGDLVVETYQTKSIAKVAAINYEGNYYLTGGDEGNGGDWYSRKYVKKLLNKLNNFSTNELVSETFKTRSLATIQYISEDGSYYLTGGDEGSGGDWYNISYIKKLVNEKDGIKVEDNIVEKYGTRSISSVKYISEDGLYYLTGGDEGSRGDWYSTKYLTKLVPSLNGYSVGESVIETFQTESEVKIQYITDDGNYYLTGGDEGSGGDWYSTKYMRKK